MYTHDFGVGRQRDARTGLYYMKCVNCGAVTIGEDPYFNLYCRKNPDWKRVENARKRLEQS